MLRSAWVKSTVRCTQRPTPSRCLQYGLFSGAANTVNRHGFHSKFTRSSTREYRDVGRFVLGSCFAFGATFYVLYSGLGGFSSVPLILGPFVGPAKTDTHTPGTVSLNEATHEVQAPSPPTERIDTSPLSDPHYASEGEVQSAIEELRNALPYPNAVDTDTDALKTYGSSENSYHPTSPHSAVVRPQSTEDVVKVVNISRKYRIPIVPYSGATSLEGHFSGFVSGSICLDMSGMDKILNINEADGDLTCQSGAQWENINHALKDKGIPFFFPLDPGPGATIGGMIGTGCSGTNAVRYGTAKGEWFLNVTVVLPSGEVIKTRSRARKSSAGFDTTKLFIGAEGTLGIVTEATLRLAPVIPTKVAMAQFPNVQRAVDAVQEVLSSPYGPHLQCVELLDDRMIHFINEGGLVERQLPVSDTLFFKIQGSPESIIQTANTVKAIVNRHHGSNFEFAATDEEADDLWQSRKYALTSVMAANPGYRPWATDVCVPVSRLPQLVYESKEDMRNLGLPYAIVGHVGDGNFHAVLLFRDDKELEAVTGAVHRMVHRALALGGTCTGEHGVGVGKKEYLVDELGMGTVDLMRTVKKAIDPLNLFNPGKLYPDRQKTENQNKGS